MLDRLERDAQETRRLLWFGYVVGGLVLAFVVAQAALLYFCIVSMGSRPLFVMAVAVVCLLGGLVCLFVNMRLLDHEEATLVRLREQIHWERMHYWEQVH